MDVPTPPKGDAGYALLVDADAADPDVVSALVEALEASAPVPVRRLHGNLHGQGIGKSWEKLARLKGFERLHRPRTTETKNGADIALAVDSMDLLTQGFRFFCLVAGDTDFGPLVERLHRGHCKTVIVSANPALHAWSPHAFTFQEVLGTAQSAKPAPPPPVAKPATAPTPPKPTSDPYEVQALLRNVIALAISKAHGTDGWVDSLRLGAMLNQVDKDYSRKKYGLSNSATVRSMAAGFPDSFEIESRMIKDVRHNFVRVRL